MFKIVSKWDDEGYGFTIQCGWFVVIVLCMVAMVFLKGNIQDSIYLDIIQDTISLSLLKF